MPAPAIIDLDQAAATGVHPDVAAAMAAAQAAGHANPSSQHALGRAARRLLEDARERIVGLLGARLGPTGHDRFVFTSGASEANHLAVCGMAAAAGAGELCWSRRDHASSVAAARAAAAGGWRLHEAALDPATGTAAAGLAATVAAASGPTILSLTLVCGQTGSVEDLPAIAAAIAAAGGRRIGTHVDATQAAGMMAIDFPALPCGTLALAPHKFGGPRGVGGLLIRGGVAITPLQAGSQERGLRGGTEAVPLAVGFARALELAAAERDETARRVAALRDHLERRLVAAARAAGIPAEVIAAAGPRCPQITTIALPGLDRQAVAMAADLAGVCLATGTACASGSSEPAPALVAMGLDPAAVRGAVRLSLGRTTTAAAIDEAVARLVPLLVPPRPPSAAG